MRQSIIAAAFVSLFLLSSCAQTPAKTPAAQRVLSLELGPMADYGASPWYTEDISIGENQLTLSPDTGASFIWATSDLCNTQACNAHQKVDTTQAGFTWIDQTPTNHSFGPWGDMITKTGNISFNDTSVGDVAVDFFVSVEYTGNQFQFLAWSGGIGFPSDSDAVSEGSGFYFKELLTNGLVDSAEFSMVTDGISKTGQFILGASDHTLYDPMTEILLEPNTSGTIPYIWGTDLYNTTLGNTPIRSLTNARFYIDSGSSLFKGDSEYILPILQILYEYKDLSGLPVFDKVFDEKNNWVSLVYRNNMGPDDYPDGYLPNLSLSMGQSCNRVAEQRAVITLSPMQYSYYVEVGDRQGSWVPAFSVLNGVGGLLVGSTFMDLFYTTFQYSQIEENRLTQGNMYLYQSRAGQQPASLICVPN